MTLESVKIILAWCTTINIGLLFLWLAFFIFAHDWIYNMHNKWFQISVEKFNAIHYALIGGYKLTIILFFLVPYLVIRTLS